MTDRRPASRFVPGYVGVPGERTFLIEVDDADGRFWYLLEKGQVEALAQYGAELLEGMGLVGVGLAMDPGPISDPEAIEFRIGQMGIEYREADDSFEVTLLPVDEDAPPVVHALTPEQLDAAVRLGRTAVAQGRPKCPRCGLAMDPDGHVCPTTNGDLRHHRP